MILSFKNNYDYIKPIEPAVNPIIRKKENSAKSRGRELTKILS